MSFWAGDRMYLYDICNIWRKLKRHWFIWLFAIACLELLNILVMKGQTKISINTLWQASMGKGNFVFPFPFAFIFSYLLFMNGIYLYGEQRINAASIIMIRGSSRTKRFLSKALFSLNLSWIYVLLLLTVIHVFVFLSGGAFNYSYDTLYSFFTVLFVFILLSILQGCLILVLNSVLAFIILFTMISISIFYKNMYLPGYYLMADHIHLVKGQTLKQAPFFMISLLFISLSVILSLQYVKKKDIL
ncbi:putative membrane protein [Scopulibacillus daqui]|uniref:Membrane protein n=1 Tax=Scopulibacillus daqui TaxID=1469162 RepID=A0ABS2PZV0_9BACL|nr:putative membrane protein [Scopulibacillus daqui]